MRAEGQPEKNPLAPTCVACVWREYSEQGLAVLVENGTVPPGYSGALYGVRSGGVTIAQFFMGRQVGFVVIPVEEAPAAADKLLDIAEQYASAMQRAADQLDAAGEAPEDPGDA